MTRPPRTYYAKRLLEHGPLTANEAQQITGWSINAVSKVLFDLAKSGMVERVTRPGSRRYQYRLVA